MPDAITLTRAERDVILDNLWYWTHEGDAVEFGTREEAVATLERLQRAFLVRDELGWTHDDPREEFTTTLDPGVLVELLRTIEKDSEEIAAKDRESFEQAKNGDTGAWFSPSFEKTVRTYQQQIQRYEHEVRVCEDLLARMANGTGDALTGLGVKA